MGAMSSSMNIRSMNWAMEIRERITEDIRQDAFENRQARLNTETIFNALSPAEYDAWVNSTPDDNHGFYLATLEKLKEVSQSQSNTVAE